MKPTVTPEQYIIAHQSSKSFAEVAEKTGLNEAACKSRSHNYRSKGVPLQLFQPARKPYNWTELAELAAKHAA